MSVKTTETPKINSFKEVARTTALAAGLGLMMAGCASYYKPTNHEIISVARDAAQYDADIKPGNTDLFQAYNKSIGCGGGYSSITASQKNGTNVKTFEVDEVWSNSSVACGFANVEVVLGKGGEVLGVKVLKKYKEY